MKTFYARVVWDTETMRVLYRVAVYVPENTTVELFCGASAAQNQLAASQSAYYSTLTQNAEAEYTQDAALFGQLTAEYLPIFQAGPNQYGFSTAETNELNTTAATSTEEGENSVKQAVNEDLAAEGGNTMLPSGVAIKENQSVAEAGAQSLTQEQEQIQQAGYQQGLQDWEIAASGLGQASSIYSNSTAAAGAANNAGAAANTTYNDIAQEDEAPFAAVMGALGGIGGAIGGAVAKNAGWGCWVAAAVFGEDFYTGVRTNLVREWMQEHAPKLVLALYRRHGRWVASKPLLVKALAPVFHWMLRRAEEQ